MVTKPISLEELSRLAAAATPGPWECPPNGRDAMNFVYKQGGMRRQICRTVAQSSVDARYIAAVDPQTVLALVRAVEAAQKFVGGKESAFLHKPMNAVLTESRVLREALAAFEGESSESGRLESTP